MLVHDVYLYHFENQTNEKTILKCVKNLKRNVKPVYIQINISF
jgi:hypothetical protein